MVKSITENEDVHRILRDRRGRAVLNLKGSRGRRPDESQERSSAASPAAPQAAIRSTLSARPPVAYCRLTASGHHAGSAAESEGPRLLICAGPPRMQVVDFVKVTSPMSIASRWRKVGEAGEQRHLLSRSARRSGRSRRGFRQPGRCSMTSPSFSATSRSSLPYYVNFEEELQLLSAVTIPARICTGCFNQATSFNASLPASGCSGLDRIDVTRRSRNRARSTLRRKSTRASSS